MNTYKILFYIILAAFLVLARFHLKAITDKLEREAEKVPLRKMLMKSHFDGYIEAGQNIRDDGELCIDLIKKANK